jgi:hypothetical protein
VISSNITKEGITMGLLDEMKDKGKDVMDDPDKKAKIEQLAKDKGMSMEEAKEHFMKHGDKS